MFHLYFGALDVCLYIAAFFVSLSLSRALCENDAASQPAFQTVSAMPVPQPVVQTSPVRITPRRSVPVASSQPATAAVQTQPITTTQVPHTSVEVLTTTATAELPEPSFEDTHSSLGNEAAVQQVAEPTAEAAENTEEELPVLNLQETRLYKLRKQSVVKLADIAFKLPESIKQYKLRGEPVVFLSTLENYVEVVT